MPRVRANAFAGGTVFHFVTDGFDAALPVRLGGVVVVSRRA
jgi:hypothetical protein